MNATEHPAPTGGTARALEKAAKYICTAKCGLCPLVVEKFPCQTECSTDTLPWRCWLAYFTRKASEEKGAAS